MFNSGTELPVNASVSVHVHRHPTATPAQIIAGTATDAIDISVYVRSVQQSTQEATIKLAWHMEMYAPNAQPKIGEWFEVFTNSGPLFNGVVQAIRDYGESRGERRMSVVLRSRDATPRWRETRVVTNTYSMGTDLIVIAQDVLAFLGLTPGEYLLPVSMGVSTVHTTLQMAEITAWDILTIIGVPSGLEPYVDAIGRFKYISRDVQRAVTHSIPASRLLSVGGNREKPKTSKVVVKWLDPKLSKSSQQDRALGGATITAGFFQRFQRQDVYWSDDRCQRAENTRLVIKQSCNSGLFPVADETYQQIDLFHGKISLITFKWVPWVGTIAMATMVATGEVGDIAPTGGGMTFTVGRPMHTIAEAIVMLIMMALGTGVYEIWGTPFDYVHAVNRTQAYDDAVPIWAEVIEELSNDFIMSEDMAQGVAVRELLYRSMSASSYSLTLTDDTTIEKGDILELPEGAKVYVGSLSRSLERGGSHVLSIEGFFV